MAEFIKGYHGPLSNYAEWHAAEIGWYYGRYTDHKSLPDFLFDESNELYSRDVVVEDHYAYTMFSIGRFYKNRPKTSVAVAGALAAVIPLGVWKLIDWAFSSGVISKLLAGG